MILKNFVRSFFFLTALLMMHGLSFSQSMVIQTLDKVGKDYRAFPWSSIKDIFVTEDENGEVVFQISDDEMTSLPFDQYIIQNGYALPLIIINTDIPMDNVPDKINYQDANFTLIDFNGGKQIESRVLIRGRGNTSFYMSDKKPYRLKFDKKIALPGVRKAKSFVLLANYSDRSLMQNCIAAFIGELFGLPYTHTMVPVDVIFNNVYRGSYNLSNKPGINAGSVDIDEDTSVMWELAENFDEEFKFRSPIFNLPVMLTDPDMSEKRFEEWKEDFIEMEEAVSKGNAADYIDLDVYAKYRIVNDILRNSDVYIPNSVKLFKKEGGKYIFGPIWDFDAAMGQNWDTGEVYIEEVATQRLDVNKLMAAIDKAPETPALIKKYFQYFFEHEEELWDFIDNLAAQIEHSAIRNHIRWNKLGDWNEHVESLKNWLSIRLDYLRKYHNL